MWKKCRHRWREILVLLRVSKNALLLFILIVFGGGFVFYLYYVIPGTDRHLTFGYAVYSVFSLVFFENILPFPDKWYLQFLFFIVPILGLFAIVEGLLQFGAMIINKNSRGQRWQIEMASIYKNHIIVCGAGRVGYRVIKELLKYGQDVVVIEPNAESQFVEKLKRLDVPVIVADARRSSILRQAGVEKADAIVPCTDDDMANLDIALDARDINPKIKVVMRMFDPELAHRIEKGFGIHTAYSTSALSAPMFAAAAMRIKTQHSFYVQDELMNLTEIEIQPCSGLIGWSIERLENELDLSVVYYQDGELIDMHPPNHIELREGTRLMVIAAMDILKKIDSLNCADS